MVKYWKAASGGRIIKGLKKSSIQALDCWKSTIKIFKRLYFHHNLE